MNLWLWLKSIENFKRYKKISSLEHLSAKENVFLVSPHGGSLVNQYEPNNDKETISKLPSIEVSYNDILNAEQIALGTFFPYNRFYG